MDIPVTDYLPRVVAVAMLSDLYEPRGQGQTPVTVRDPRARHVRDSEAVLAGIIQVLL